MTHVEQLPSGSHAATAFISKLTGDILWLIFRANASSAEFLVEDDTDDEEEESYPRPLETTRISSQVCREWRCTILQSSSLWGRLLDWRVLNQEADNWRNEVLKRSGTSFLWVNAGYIHGAHHPVAKESTLLFFTNLLDNHWDRIEMFVMSVSRDDQARHLPIVFQRAAPNLKEFTYIEGSTTGLTHWSGAMFAGHAPQLKLFHITEFRCSLDPSWISNIRDMSLGRHFLYQEVYESLRFMPLLETLALYNHKNFDFRHARIHLPYLRTFKLYDSLQYSNDIDPAPGCSFICNYKGYDSIALPLEYYETSIIKLLQSYLNVHPVDRIFFECTSYGIGLSDRSIHTYPPEIRENVFELTFSCQISDDHIMSFLKICSSSGKLFSKVTELVLVGVDFKPQFYHSFMNFLSCFPALNRVCVDDRSIPGLLSDGLPSPILFSNVQTLGISNIWQFKPSDTSGSQPFEQFLTSRWNAGYPIKTLDLTDHMLGLDFHNLDFLEQFNGMRVISRLEGEVEEYICGSGRPEALQFSSKFPRYLN